MQVLISAAVSEVMWEAKVEATAEVETEQQRRVVGVESGDGKDLGSIEQACSPAAGGRNAR